MALFGIVRGMSAQMRNPTEPLHLPDQLPDGPRWRDRWPLAWSDGGLLLAAGVVLVAVYYGIGHLLTGPLKNSALVRWDQDALEWFADRRTSTGKTLATWGSGLGDTATKVIGTLVICLLLLWFLKRWYEALLAAISLIFEATVFITVTFLVKRPRPDVPRLQDSPVNSSFPSGHTAAAATYLALAIVIGWHTRHRWVRVGLIVLTAVITFCVALSRLYQGMHFVTDVIAGAILGVVSVLIVDWVMRRAVAHRQSRAPVIEGVTATVA